MITTHSKKGTTSVFLIMILASMLVTVGLFIHAASQTMSRSYADAVFDLAGRSVLSEYDLQLQKRYGIFAVHTDESQAESKIEYYSDYSFHNNYLKEALRGRDHTDTLRLRLDSVQVNLKGYSMTDTELFEQQILEYMKTGILKDMLSKEQTAPSPQQDIVLRNEKIINSLPSKGYKSSILNDLKQIVENGLPDLGDIGIGVSKTYLVDEYIMGHFLNYRRGNNIRNTFFLNEAEYILKGNFEDRRNYKEVRTDLLIIRNVLNLNHIKSDPQKMRKIEEITTFLILIKGKEIGTAAVMEAWALAEAENDLRLMEAGKPVELVKNADNWATKLSSTLEFLWEDGYIEPKEMTGYDYEDYLRILLFLENREKKLLRCMDLIQLNMKGSYNRDFDLKEYYGGFEFEAVVKGQKYTYIHKY